MDSMEILNAILNFAQDEGIIENQDNDHKNIILNRIYPALTETSMWHKFNGVLGNRGLAAGGYRRRVLTAKGTFEHENRPANNEGNSSPP